MLLPLGIGQYPSCFFLFLFCFFFGVAQAFKRRFCSGICYFSVFLHPIMIRFVGSNMLQRGDYAREICYFVVVHASPFPLQPVYMIFFSFPVYLLWPYLATSHFSFTAFTMLCSMHVCMHVCMYVKYTFVDIPHRDIYHTMSRMVRSIGTIFQHIPHYVADGEIDWYHIST